MVTSNGESMVYMSILYTTVLMLEIEPRTPIGV